MTVAHKIKTPMEVQNIFPTRLCDIHTHFNFRNKNPLAQAGYIQNITSCSTVCQRLISVDEGACMH